MFWTFIVIFFYTTIVFAHDGLSKRGLAYGTWVNDHDDAIWNAAKSPLTWYYNFRSSPSDGVDDWKMQFVPMMWGNEKNDWSFPDKVKDLMNKGMNISYVLGFNEPDICSGGGSCIDAETAADSWKKYIEPLKKHGIKLGAPSVTGGDTVWLDAFFDACKGDCTVDFMPLHFYSDVVGVKEWIHNISSIYKKDIWLTEFACPDCSLDVTQLAFNETIAFLDSYPHVTRYSYFGSFRTDESNDFLGPNVAMLDNNGGLTEIGAWYLGLDSDAVGKTNIGPATPKPPPGEDSNTSGSSQSYGSRLDVPFEHGEWLLTSALLMLAFIVSSG